MSIIEVSNLGKKYQLLSDSNKMMTLGEKCKNDLLKLKNRGSNNGQGEEKADFWALQEVSFSLEAGKKLGIIGPNGAGKSTLLKILSRITPPTTGKAILRGRVASLLEVGTGFNPELTGRENVYLNGIILGMSRAEIKNRFDEIVAFAEVENFIDQPYKRFSSGMSMRLAFAVAAFLDPEILIVDEVLAVGDMAFQKKSLARMKEASQNEGKTIIFVSHNLSAIENLCDQALYLDKGRIVEEGKVEKVVRDYSLEILNAIESRQDPEKINFRNHQQKKNIDEGLQSLKIFVNGKKSQRCTLGDKVELIFQLKMLQDRKDLKLSLSIKNTQGEPVANFDNSNFGIELNTKEGESEMIIIFPNWGIYGEGKFLVDVSLSYRNELIDLLPDAFYLEICPRDVWESGRLLNPNTNLLPLSAIYKIKKNNNEIGKY